MVKKLVAMVRPETMGEEAVQYVVAKYDYDAQEAQELSIKKGEKCVLLDGTKKWWKVQNQRGDAGYVPSNFMKKAKTSILSSLRNTLGRRKGSETRAQLQQATVRNGSGGSGGDNTSDHGSYNSDSQLCDTSAPTIAKYAYSAQQPDEITLNKGDHVTVIEKSSDGWWKGRKDNSEVGWFPSNYVREELVEDFSDSYTYANPADNDAAQIHHQHRTLLTAAAELTHNKHTCHCVLDTVKAMYPYTSRNQEELSFDKDEILDILEKPDLDPDWWKARSRCGDVGLIPRNYVKTLSKDSGLPPTPESRSDSSLCTSHSQGGASSSRTPSSTGGGGVRSQYSIAAGGSVFAVKEWYWGNISRADAEHMLNKYAQNGDFLLRVSETNVGDFSITLKAAKKNKHFRILAGEGGAYSIGQQTFDQLDDLVEHYKKHPIFRHESEKLYLVKPFLHPIDVPGGHPLPELPESPRTSDECDVTTT